MCSGEQACAILCCVSGVTGYANNTTGLSTVLQSARPVKCQHSPASGRGLFEQRSGDTFWAIVYDRDCSPQAGWMRIFQGREVYLRDGCAVLLGSEKISWSTWCGTCVSMHCWSQQITSQDPSLGLVGPSGPRITYSICAVHRAERRYTLALGNACSQKGVMNLMNCPCVLHIASFGPQQRKWEETALPGQQHGPSPDSYVWAKCCGLNHSPKKSSMSA